MLSYPRVFCSLIFYKFYLWNFPPPPPD